MSFLKPYTLQLASVAGRGFSQVEGTLYRKEVAYPGRFIKKRQGKVEFELAIDEPLIDQWIATFNKMRQNNLTVPVPVGHTSNPEARRGEVEKLVKEDNGRGQKALYAYIRFRSPEVAEQLKDSQVSLYMPPEMTDGLGNRYVRPITHVAITDYPVIPGLGRFQAVAAALELTEDTTMRLAELAAALGVDVPEGASDEEIAQAIIEAKGSDGEGGGDDVLEDDGGAEDELEDDGTGGSDMPSDGGDVEEEEEEEVDPNRPPAMGFSLPPTVIRHLIKARRTELYGLVRDRKINRATADRLARRYLTNDSVAIALSNEQLGAPGDDFDSLIAALSLNEPLYQLGERTGPQIRKGQRNPLIVDAERRAKRGR